MLITTIVLHQENISYSTIFFILITCTDIVKRNKMLITLLLVEATCLFSDPLSNILQSSSLLAASIMTEPCTNTRP